MPEQQNLKNAYVCNLLHATVTIHKDEGTTPMFIDCPVCHKIATSRMGQVDDSLTPTYEWYKPTKEELNKLKWDLPQRTMQFHIQEHVNKGGLLLRKIN